MEVAQLVAVLEYLVIGLLCYWHRLPSAVGVYIVGFHTDYGRGGHRHNADYTVCCIRGGVIGGGVSCKVGVNKALAVPAVEEGHSITVIICGAAELNFSVNYPDIAQLRGIHNGVKAAEAIGSDFYCVINPHGVTGLVGCLKGGENLCQLIIGCDVYSLA